ncbi:MAG: SPOR domain-containing protein [Bacteroidaceae bacterium]|nr:SPOR domain-containing protein [Bacteroidaceae bacterium]
MKKTFFLGFALLVAFAMTSCKSNESAYKKAYEKAQAAQAQTTQAYVATTQQTTPVQVTPVTPVTTTPTNTVPANTVTTDYSNISVRTESVKLVSGAGLKPFSVVVGSFGLQSNAQTLQSKLAGKGYAAQVVSSVVNGMTMYRVVASTHETKDQAAQSRAALLGEYPDAWLLYQK